MVQRLLSIVPLTSDPLEHAVGLDALPESPELHLPEADPVCPEVTVLVPAMNEEITISRFVSWCLEGFEKAELNGEVLIVDSSVDATPQLALTAGARVLRVPRRGLGQAYTDAIPFVRGRYVVMGDADCTYDFREIGPFVDAMRDGAEFVIGSRFRGTIERGAMPLHHRYFGSPLTTVILDVLFATRFTDIHCGMRGMPLEALKGIRLQAKGWEYASEMIVNSVRSELRTAEIPISFYRDRDGRVSNVKRAGWTTPFRAGWDTLRVLFTSAADYLLLRPGAFFALLGTFGVLVLGGGPLEIGGATLTLHTQTLALATAILGWFAVGTGLVVRTIYEPEPRTAQRWTQRLSFGRAVLVCSILAGVGLVMDAAFVVGWWWHDRQVDEGLEFLSHLSLVGLFAISASFILFTTSMTMSSLTGRRRDG